MSVPPLRPAVAALALFLVLGEGASAAAQPRPAPARVERARELFEEGLAAYEAGRLPEALERLRAAHGILPERELAFNIGRVYERMGDAPQAIRWFRDWLRAAPEADPARADVERRIAALEALAERQRAIIFSAPPTTDELTAEARQFFLRGVAMFGRRQFAAAHQAFSAAHQFAPELPEVLYNLAVTCERLDQRSDAILYYQEYLRARPQAPDADAVREKIRALRERRG